MHPTASLFVTAGMAAIVALVVVMLVLGYARATRSRARGLGLGAALVVWLVALGGLAVSGVLRRWDARPPPMLLVVAVGFVLALVLGRGKIGTAVARGLPLGALIGFHAFRLPLELVMHRAAAEGTMPVQMSFSGFNFDIFSGVAAIVVGTWVARGNAPRWAAMGFAGLSSVLLATIVTIAMASLPATAAFGSSPERLATWIGFFPFVWLPGLLVPAAIFGEVVLFRRLMSRTACRGDETARSLG